MRVLVMGAGSVGGYYGGLLAQVGHDVTLVARGPHLAAIQKHGLEIRNGEGPVARLPVRAVATPAEAAGDPDLVLFTVKCYDTIPAAEALRPAVGPATAVLPLQNGVDSADRLAAILGRERVLIGTTLVQATLEEPGVIIALPTYQRITFGEPTGEVTPRVEAIAQALGEAGITVTVTTDPQHAVWQKFVGLAAIATLESACMAPRGALWDIPEAVAVYQQLMAEAVAVGRSAGVALSDADVETILATHRLAALSSKTSMQVDFERRRRVELEQLTGAVVRMGRELAVPTPTFATLYAALKVRALSFGGLS